MTRRAAGAGALAAAAACYAASLALFWPGYALYDSVSQFEQALSGAYDDWHPPTMAHLWALLHAAFGGGAGPMLAVQLALYWLGIGLIAGALLRTGQRHASWAVLAIGLCPLFLGWDAAVLKDAQMLSALLAAAGLIAWWRLADRAPPIVAQVAVAVLLSYATLVRANAVFATVPFAVLALTPRGRWLRDAGLIVTGVVAVLAVSPVINHRLLGAESTGVEQTEALFDLAGIAARAPSADGTGLAPNERRQIVDRRCARPFFWDPLGDPDHCDATMDRLRALPTARLYATLVGAMLHHPLAYAGHRVAHLNSTERWLVPAYWPDAAPPILSEPNTLGLATPGRAAAWQRAGGWLAETPIGWPFAWLIVAFTMLAALRSAIPSPARDLSRALAASAVLLEASFTVLSIASDLRYHLWPMLATALAAVIGTGAARHDRRALAIGGGVLLIECTVAVVARLALAAPPQTYQAMLG